MSGGGRSDSQANTTSQNTTTNVTQDRRLVVDNGGVGVTADNSAVSIQMTDFGAVRGAAGLAALVSQQGSDTSNHAIDAAVQLGKSGTDMLRLNTDLAAHITSGGFDLVKQLNDSGSRLAEQSLAQSQAALQVVSQVVTKPLDVSDPSHQLVLVGIAVVGVVAFASMKGSK